MGIDKGDAGKSAREADHCAPFLEIREESRGRVLHKISMAHGETGEIGLTKALDLPFRLLL